MYRKKIIVNKYEEKTYEILDAVVKKYDARLFSKTRVADVLQITNSGLPSNEYSYALMAHFDFVITDKDSTPEFAVEFDESHHQFDKYAISNDEKKNNICRKLEFPLLRITSEYFEKIGRFPTILSWITELYFLEKRFYVAQEQGQIPMDEPWLWFNLVGYDPFIHHRAFIEKAYEKGLCCDPLTENISGSRNDGKSYATLSVLKIKDNEYIASLVECSAINFYAIPPRMISTEIAEYNIAKKLRKYIEGNDSSISNYPAILKMRKYFVEKYDIFPYSIKLDAMIISVEKSKLHIFKEAIFFCESAVRAFFIKFMKIFNISFCAFTVLFENLMISTDTTCKNTMPLLFCIILSKYFDLVMKGLLFFHLVKFFVLRYFVVDRV